MYIVRPIRNGEAFEFVADADGIDPNGKLDTNNDGVYGGDEDALGLPGLSYDVSVIEVLREKKYDNPIANSDLYTDKWGTFLTGYAPIRDADGKMAAVMAVDISFDQINLINQRTFEPLLIFLLIFSLLIAVRLATFNGIFKESLKNPPPTAP